MKTLVSATILLISVTGATAQSSAGTSVVWQSPAPQQPGAASSGWALTTSLSPAGDLEDQARETVLVVPGPDLKPEALAAVTEDMTVMCRIFDKAINPDARSTGASIYMGRADSSSRLLVQQTGRTQGLYLGGYGAVFFIQADFPLVPPPQQAQEPKPEESADHVWSQTMNELRGQPQARDADETGPAYDAQRVESLKAMLIKTLRHAANLQIRPQDQITLVVGSRSSTTGSAKGNLGWFNYQERRGSVPTKIRTRPDNPEPDPAATLVLRAAKADVDVLAAGKLPAEQFAAKVQTLWSVAPPQAQQPPSTQPAPAAR